MCFCSALCNTRFKGAYQWSLQSQLQCYSYSKGWSWLRYQVHNDVVGLLGCKCAAVIDKANESSREYLGTLSQDWKQACCRVTSLNPQNILRKNLKRVNEECAPLMLQLPKPLKHCSLHPSAPNGSLCIFVKVNSDAKTSVCTFIKPYLNK